MLDEPKIRHDVLHLTARDKKTLLRHDFYFSTLEEAKKANPNFIDWVMIGFDTKDNKSP